MSEVFPGPGPTQHTPQPGQHGLRVGEGPATNAAGFITVGGHLFAPLQGLDAANPRMGGYGWLDKTDGGATLHPGTDLNAGSGGCNSDEGLLVVTPLAGVVRAVLYWDGYTSGEGNHLWLELDSPDAPGPTWVHYDHLQRIDVTEGQRLVAGEPVARAGRSGNWQCAHLHTELLPAAPAQGYFQWPYGWSRAQVEAAYYEPRAWWDAASAKVQGAQPPEVQMILSGAQSAAVQAVMWGGYPFAPDHAIPTSWRQEWRRGVWRGRAISEEQLLPEDTAEGKPGGTFQLFEFGVCAWLPGHEASWTG